jgi:hypothetical protein
MRRCLGAALSATIHKETRVESPGGSVAQSEWIYDWNLASPPLIPPGTRILLK